MTTQPLRFLQDFVFSLDESDEKGKLNYYYTNINIRIWIRINITTVEKHPVKFDGFLGAENLPCFSCIDYPQIRTFYALWCIPTIWSCFVFWPEGSSRQWRHISPAKMNEKDIKSSFASFVPQVGHFSIIQIHSLSISFVIPSNWLLNSSNRASIAPLANSLAKPAIDCSKMMSPIIAWGSSVNSWKSLWMALWNSDSIHLFNKGDIWLSMITTSLDMV